MHNLNTERNGMFRGHTAAQSPGRGTRSQPLPEEQADLIGPFEDQHSGGGQTQAVLIAVSSLWREGGRGDAFSWPSVPDRNKALKGPSLRARLREAAVMGSTDAAHPDRMHVDTIHIQPLGLVQVADLGLRWRLATVGIQGDMLQSQEDIRGHRSMTSQGKVMGLMQ